MTTTDQGGVPGLSHAGDSTGRPALRRLVVDPVGFAADTWGRSPLLTRAADVVLKERRLLVLMVRETPFHLGHLRTMTQLAEMGAVILPPLPAFYAHPESVDDIVNQSVGRALDLFGLDWDATKRWGEDLEQGRRPQARTQG